ncbi:MAG: MgtC/SapB family protein, partial [Muribaculaceae bacterium]|nr:MgtC/SapB family protein [Muribaculaceae bacterium]
LMLSMVLGAIVGYERKRKGQTAGVRTFSLISMGATLAMILSIYVPQEYIGLKNGDPARIAAQVVTGIGFLGAGAIIQMKGSVRGLTTAAGIWMVAALGMAVGAGMYVLATIATALILFILVHLEQIERRLSVGSEARIIRASVSVIVSDIEPYRKAMRAHHVSLTSYYLDYDYNESATRLNMIVLAKDPVDYISLFQDIRQIHPTSSLTVTMKI